MLVRYVKHQRVKMLLLIAEDIEDLLSLEKLICGKSVREAALA